MLASSRLRVFCGGNLAPGRPFSEALLMGRKDCYVVEASSFQLERVQWFAPHIAVILNITPDHLNRHGTMRRYAEAKFRILRRQSGEDYAVLNRDDPVVRQARLRGRAAKRFFSLKQQVNGAYLADGVLWYEGKRVMPASQIRLPGEHNIANGLAAMAAARLMGADLPAVRRTLRGFSGLPHRLEFVRRLRGVDYVNSSMTTNPVAGARTLEAVAEDKRQTDGTGQSAGVVLIAGGREKGLPTRVYTRAMQRHAKWVFLIGESGPRLARELRGRGFRSFDVSADLKQAVRAAMGKAGVGDVVLFSPGCASFDQFTDFEARGEAFRKEVGSLGHN
jgi:UDP-N-acetylmuramoylalanine--D-glutamate ligase